MLRRFQFPLSLFLANAVFSQILIGSYNSMQLLSTMLSRYRLEAFIGPYSEKTGAYASVLPPPLNDYWQIYFQVALISLVIGLVFSEVLLTVIDWCVEFSGVAPKSCLEFVAKVADYYKVILSERQLKSLNIVSRLMYMLFVLFVAMKVLLVAKTAFSNGYIGFGDYLIGVWNWLVGPAKFVFNLIGHQ